LKPTNQTDKLINKLKLTDKSALLIIDMQNDFISGSLAVPGANEIIPIINDLSVNYGFQTIFRTRDWHPRNHVSFASNHPGNNPFTQITVFETGREQFLWPDHCVQGSHGADYDPSLVLNGSEILKGTKQWVESYSGFGNELEDTQLNKHLQALGIKDV